jgi:hypothetical protein
VRRDSYWHGGRRASNSLSASGNSAETREILCLDAMASAGRFASDEIHKLGNLSRGSCSTDRLCSYLAGARSFFLPVLASALSLALFLPTSAFFEIVEPRKK